VAEEVEEVVVVFQPRLIAAKGKRVKSSRVERSLVRKRAVHTRLARVSGNKKNIEKLQSRENPIRSSEPQLA